MRYMICTNLSTSSNLPWWLVEVRWCFHQASENGRDKGLKNWNTSLSLSLSLSLYIYIYIYKCIYRIFRYCFLRWNFLTWGQLAKWIKLYIKVFSRTCFSSFLFYQSPLIYLQVPVFSLSHVFPVWMFWFCVHYLMVSDWSLPFNSSMLLYYFLGDLTSFVVLTCDFIMWAFLYTKIVYMLVPLLAEEPWIPVGFIRICRCFSFHWHVLTWPSYIYTTQLTNFF